MAALGYQVYVVCPGFGDGCYRPMPFILLDRVNRPRPALSRKHAAAHASPASRERTQRCQGKGGHTEIQGYMYTPRPQVRSACRSRFTVGGGVRESAVGALGHNRRRIRVSFRAGRRSALPPTLVTTTTSTQSVSPTPSLLFFCPPPWFSLYFFLHHISCSWILSHLSKCLLDSLAPAQVHFLSSSTTCLLSPTFVDVPPPVYAPSRPQKLVMSNVAVCACNLER